MALRALIFDFDGLIVDTESAVLDAWNAIHREDGRHADPAVLHALVGTADVVADVWTAYPATHDRPTLDARLSRIARENCRRAPVLPGAFRLWEQARAAGLRLAVASNSSHAHVDAHLAARGLLPLFDVVLCRDDVPVGKPDPAPYLAALARLGLSPHEAIAFEDSVPGHLSAARAGLRVVVVPNPLTRHQTFPAATLRVDSLAELDLTRLEQLPLAQPFPSGRI